MAKSREITVMILCEHDSDSEFYDPSLLRKCHGTSLIECTKCYTLMDEV